MDNMNMNIAGMQMVGPDICGFGGNTTDELCARWYQLAAVYPFARSHNDYWSIPQEPFSMSDNVLRSAFYNINLRYSFLKQYYSFWLLSEGTTPFFTSPALYPATLSGISDLSTYDNIINTQFLILGRPLMLAPILEEQKEERKVYFLNYSLINPVVTQGSHWVDVVTGFRYEPSTFATIRNTVPSVVSMYMVEGSAFMIQDTTEVTKTEHLNN